MNVALKVQQLESVVPLSPPQREKSAVSVIGLGYVGAVSSACLADLGHPVVGVDVDTAKVRQIASGVSPIHESGLGRLLDVGVRDELITATTSISDAVVKTDVTFVSVGTPTAEDGGCDYRYIIAAAQAIGEGLARKNAYHVVVMRCSIPPGATLNVMVKEIEYASNLKMGEDFGVCFNPEFLREGTAIADFKAPPKTVIGANDDRAAEMVEAIYRPVDPNPIRTSIEVAEMVKYVDNVWHATKVCFGNEIGRLCKPLEIDSHQVMDIFVQDTKLNLSPYYLKPGFAYGGSCLPKEVRAVKHLADQLAINTPLIDSLSETNAEQINNAIDLVRQSGARRVGFLGLAFKAGTDDLRESPILEVINTLLAEGYEVTAYDPAIEPTTRIDSQFDYVRYACPHLEPTVKALPTILKSHGLHVTRNADVLVVTQKTKEIQTLLTNAMHATSVVDLVRVFDHQPSAKDYQGIGW